MPCSSRRSSRRTLSAAETALERGHARLVEKPLATSLDEAEALRRAGRKNDLRLGVVQNWRTKSVGRALRAAISDGRIGAVSHVFFRYLRDRELPHLPDYLFDERGPRLERDVDPPLRPLPLRPRRGDRARRSPREDARLEPLPRRVGVSASGWRPTRAPRSATRRPSRRAVRRCRSRASRSRASWGRSQRQRLLRASAAALPARCGPRGPHCGRERPRQGRPVRAGRRGDLAQLRCRGSAVRRLWSLRGKTTSARSRRSRRQNSPCARGGRRDRRGPLAARAVGPRAARCSSGLALRHH